MDIIHMIKDNEETYVVRDFDDCGGDDITWMDAAELILTLARAHGDNYAIKEIWFKDLQTCDEVGSFDCVWNDRGTTEELADAFEAIYAFAEIMI